LSPLQERQAGTQFSVVLKPPWLRGNTWSIDSDGYPQYIQLFPVNR